MIRSLFCFLSLLCKSVCTKYIHTYMYISSFEVVSLIVSCVCVYWLMFSCNQVYIIVSVINVFIWFWCCVLLLLVLLLLFFFHLLLKFISLESGCFSDRSFPFLQNSKLQNTHTVRFLLLLLVVDGSLRVYVINYTARGFSLRSTEGKFWMCICERVSVIMC